MHSKNQSTTRPTTRPTTKPRATIGRQILHSLQSWADRNTDIRILPLACISIIIVMSIITSGKFLSPHNIRSISFQLPELGLFSLAMMLAMLTGGINLSIISSANFTSVIMALLLRHFLVPTASGPAAAFTVLLIVMVGLLFSLLLGCINGVLIAYIQVSPVLTTLGTMILYEGLTLSITKGYVVSDFPQALLFIGNGIVFGIPVPFIIFVLVSIVMSILLRRKILGRYLRMIGSNSRASEYAGIHVRWALVRTYMISGLLAGLAGTIMISRFNSANARYGVSYMLLSVLISVLGGTNPDGGFGKVSGVLFALFTLQALTSGFNLLEISSFVTVALWGLLLVFVIAYRHHALKKRNRTLMRMVHDE